MGVDRVATADHALFLIDSDVTSTEVWQGLAQPQRDWSSGDVAFMPAGTEMRAKYVSRRYDESIILMPDTVLRGVAIGDINLDAIDITYRPLPSVGIARAARNLAMGRLQHGHVDMLVESLTNTLAICLLCVLSKDGGQALMELRNGLSPERRRRVLEFIEANIADPITLTALANVAALSPHHFVRSFRAAMGVTPVRYVWNQRIQRAKTLLADRSLSLLEIALSSGFKSASHFATAFKQATGKTPSAYRYGLALIVSLFIGAREALTVLEMAVAA